MVSDDVEPVEINSIDAEMQQATRPGGQRVMLFNGTHVGIGSADEPARGVSHYVNLAFLDPQPAKQLDRPGKVAVTVMAVAGTVAILIAARVSLHLGILQAIALLSVVFATFGGLGVALREQAQQTVFLTRHGRAPLLRFSGSRKNHVGEKDFVQTLVDSIRRAHEETPGDRGTLLRDEMREHRRLADEGLLTPGQFQSARTLILRAHDQ